MSDEARDTLVFGVTSRGGIQKATHLHLGRGEQHRYLRSADMPAFSSSLSLDMTFDTAYALLCRRYA